MVLTRIVQRTPNYARCMFGHTPKWNIPKSNPLVTNKTLSYMSLLRPCSSILHKPNYYESSILGTHNISRSYAKKAKKEKKDKGKGSKPKVSLTDAELNEVIRYDKMCQQLNAAVQSLKQDYITQLTVRTSIGALDQIPVETPDGKFPLIQLGQIAQKNPQLVVINLAATPQYIKNVTTAIIDSGMNLSPQQDGTTLFVPIPKITREHRENLAKNAKTLCTKTKDKIRDIHNSFGRDLKKQKTKSSDDLIHNVQSYLDLKMKEHIELADELMQVKQKELLQDKS